MPSIATCTDTLGLDYTRNVVNEFVMMRDCNPGTANESFRGIPIIYSITNTVKSSYSRIVEGCSCKKNERENSKADIDLNKDISIILSLWKRIDRLKQYGVDWIDEDIDVGPTEDTIYKARSIIPNLVYNDLIPFRITPSIDEGVCIALQKKRILTYIEFYNDGDIGMIAEDYIDKKTLANIDLEITDIIPTLKKVFK